MMRLGHYRARAEGDPTPDLAVQWEAAEVLKTSVMALAHALHGTGCYQSRYHFRLRPG